MDTHAFSHFLDALRTWSDEGPRRSQGSATLTQADPADAASDDDAEYDYEALEQGHLGADDPRDVDPSS